MGETRFEGWAILELMGHRRLAGYVSGCEVAGTKLLRIDVPDASGKDVLTQMYGPQAIYCLTPTTEEVVRRLATLNRPEPVHPWELQAPQTPRHEDLIRPEYPGDLGEDEDRSF